MAVNFRKVHVDNVIESATKVFVTPAEKTAIGTALQTSNNLSEVTPSVARTNLELGTVATFNTGTTSGTIPVLTTGGKLPDGMVPNLAITNVFVAADTAARDALVASAPLQTGDVVKVTDSDGLGNTQTYIYDGSVFIDIQETSDVISVGGQTGVITMADLNLENVDNTSDLNKPISTATQSALNAKLDDSQLSLDGTMAGNSDTEVPSESAVVTYVSSQIGNITASDIGLGNVDNTSDANKPISTATQSALDAKLDDSQLDIDDTFTAASDTQIPSQLAVKTYVDNSVSNSSPGVTTSLPLTVSGTTITLAGNAQGITSIYVVDQGILLTGYSHTKGTAAITLDDSSLNGLDVYVTYLSL